MREGQIRAPLQNAHVCISLSFRQKLGSGTQQNLYPDTPHYGYRPKTTLGGLETTVDFEVLDTEDKVIDGLYAVGNTQGGRFLVDYPLPAPGASHGFALTHGMLVGRILAKL